ncbi:hypothetical protein OCGS_1210 [Oceaniovalibus guishaninsula JLT2003]|uniref:CENP-V/GFA domain-containing protein n=1 Tax=Oceaniovalibus guishaninsula JLT2003 TaxID=1231392 RepID=K2HCN9_9RHOB|nr:DUF6151 family protein [Oceaniovalibus guishaninsula]EKE44372.1 hypothetical protein OCGS_1210 [Oceaniovalibus guishaninsula JLT2003]
MRAWSCTCGAVRLDLADGPGDATPIVCYCRDCRAHARALGRDDLLDPAGGLVLRQTTPGRIALRAGADRLACLRLTPRGPLRFYAACCDTPLAVVAPFRAVPFASVVMPPQADPPAARVHRGSATARVPRPHGNVAALLFTAARRTLAARLAGAHMQTPFFTDNGRPVAAPRSLTPSERRAAYA